MARKKKQAEKLDSIMVYVKKCIFKTNINKKNGRGTSQWAMKL